jgi:hypothetical protein
MTRHRGSRLPGNGLREIGYARGIVMLFGKLPFLQTSDGEHYFSDLEIPHDPNSARNGNPGLKWSYFIFQQFPVIGLNGALLIP